MASATPLTGIQPANPLRRARQRQRKGKPKKSLKINGLDLLHSQTLLSTSSQGLILNILSCFCRR